jgi:hypothetical protein
VPGPVIEGRLGISPSTHSAFQAVISPGINRYQAVRRRKQRTARKRVLPNNGLEMYTSHGDEGTILSSSKTKYDSDVSWRLESDGSESDSEEVVSTNSSEAVLRHDDEQDEHWDIDGAIHFPLPLTEKYEGEHLGIDLLRVVQCSYDVDSIYLMGDHPSQVLRSMGSDGTCQFNSSIKRTNTTNTSRLAADYHGTVNLRPRLVGQRLRRLKVISLHKFPNIGLCNVLKNNICYTFSLFLLEAPLISERNYIKHEMLLTVIAALNIAIDGHFPYDSHDGYGRGIDSVDDQEWSSLNYFELQDGSKAQKKKIHGSQKQLSVGASAMFFHRYERALELMANNPELIDSANQLRDSYYWQKRQGIRPEESGAVDVAQLKVNAAFLSTKSTIVATAAGTKKSFSIEGRETWNGKFLEQEQDHNAILQLFEQFQTKQFDCIKKSLEKSFDVLEKGSTGNSVQFFFDVGLEMQPIGPNFVLLPEIQKSKCLLQQIRAGQFSEILSGSSDSEESSDEEETALADEVNVNLSVDLNATDYLDNLVKSIDNRVALSRLQVMSYPKRFTRYWGNVHSGSVRLNAVEGDEKVKLVPPTSAHCLGGQIYTPSIRLETMHQTRSEQSRILSMTAHAINIMTMGEYLNATVTQSMNEMAVGLELLKEIFDHMFDRRERETSNAVRIEIFLVYNNWGKPVGCPLFVPTDCVQIFDKDSVNDFEWTMVQTHFVPIFKIFGGLRRLAEENRVLSLEKETVILLNRIVASLEIVTGIVDNVLKSPGIIQRNIMEVFPRSIGITMDIPHVAREQLTRGEILRTGFKYGVKTWLFPQMPDRVPTRNPPRTLRDIAALISGHGARPFDFPVFFSGMDRVVARSLSPGLNVGMLEGMKAQAKALILEAAGENPSTVGMMHVPNYNALLACDEQVRHRLLRRLSRLLIMYVCHHAWKELVDDKIFGDNPNFESVQVLPYRLSSHFEDFPFVEAKIAVYKHHISGTKFEKKRTVTSAGKSFLDSPSFCPSLKSLGRVRNMICFPFAPSSEGPWEGPGYLRWLPPTVPSHCWSVAVQPRV